jgi:hypothetical protein
MPLGSEMEQSGSRMFIPMEALKNVAQAVEFDEILAGDGTVM